MDSNNESATINHSERYEELLTQALSTLRDIHTLRRNLGEILIEAKRTLTSNECDNLWHVLLENGMTKAEIQAAQLVAEDKLDPRLITRDVPMSKILTLAPNEQQRLLSGDPLPLRLSTGAVIEKPWAEMNGIEKNQVLGKKGGGIQTPEAQHTTADRAYHRTRFVHGSFDVMRVRLNLIADGKEGEIDLATLAADLRSEGSLDRVLTLLRVLGESAEPIAQAA